MTFDLTKIDLALLNSMTKYPSIPTYHTLDPKNGALSEPASAFEGDVIGTEKVDGTNSRIILTPDGRYLICAGERSTSIALYRVHGDELELVKRAETGHKANWVWVMAR